MKQKKESKKVKKADGFNWKLALVILISLYLMCSTLISITEIKYSAKNFVESYSFENTLDLIESNCKSTYFTQKWDGKDWYVFVDSNYKSIEDCIRPKRTVTVIS